MQLSELIQEDVIKVGLEAHDKWEAIQELVDILVAAHEVRQNDRAAVIEAVNTRERSFSTGLKYGLAVPHGAVDCVKDIIADLFRKEDPHNPLSDQEVVKILGDKGIKIARRTVAKYRFELNILPSNLRKVY